MPLLKTYHFINKDNANITITIRAVDNYEAIVLLTRIAKYPKDFNLSE